MIIIENKIKGDITAQQKNKYFVNSIASLNEYSPNFIIKPIIFNMTKNPTKEHKKIKIKIIK